MYERSRVNVKMGPLLPLCAAFYTFPLFYLTVYFLFNNKLLPLNNVILHGISIHDISLNQLHYLSNIYEKKSKLTIKVTILFNNTSF